MTLRVAMSRFRRVAGALALLAAAAPADAGTPGVQFRGLAPCREENRLVFTARDPGWAVVDTLCLDPTTAEMSWGGGPYRGVAAGNADTVYAATRLGRLTLVGGERAGIASWTEPLAGFAPDDATAWPSMRDTTAAPAPRGAVPVDGVAIFPERYLKLRDGTVIFLIDAENPPTYDEFLYDLHARIGDATEWTLSRNLAVRTWVVSGDSTSWALAARAWVPDYGGQVRDVVLAGRNGSAHTFEIGDPRSLLWDDAGNLWILDGRGRLVRILPSDGAWEMRAIAAGDPDCGCTPADPESLWTWAHPARFTDREDALAAAARLAAETTRPVDAPWLARDPDGGLRICWGGFLSREALLAADGRPPVPEATIGRVAIEGSEYVGTASRVPVRRLGGVAVLREIRYDGKAASEIWWRYLTSQRAVRMAGPWGL